MSSYTESALKHGSQLLRFNPYCLDFQLVLRMKGRISFSVKIFIYSLGFLPFSLDFGCYHSHPVGKIIS